MDYAFRCQVSIVAHICIGQIWKGVFGGFRSPIRSSHVLSSLRFGVHSHIADLFREFLRCRNDEDVVPCTPKQQQQHAAAATPRSNISSCNGNRKQNEWEKPHSLESQGCVQLCQFNAFYGPSTSNQFHPPPQSVKTPLRAPESRPLSTICLLLHVGHINYCRATGFQIDRSTPMFNPLDLAPVLIIHAHPAISFHPIQSGGWMDSFIWDIGYLPTACSLYAGQTRLLVVACLNIGNCQCAGSAA